MGIPSPAAIQAGSNFCLNLTPMYSTICPRCKIEPKMSGFGWCANCKAAYNKIYLEKYRSEHPEKIAEANREQYLKNRGDRLSNQKRYKLEKSGMLRRNGERLKAEKRALLVQIKDRPCADCGHKFPAPAMDFDHVRGTKKGNLATMAGNQNSTETLLEEVSKCDVVCACCHRLRTHERRLAISGS